MFIKKPRSSDAYEGDTVIIMCEVIGDPKPEVVWLRDFLKVTKKKKINNHYFCFHCMVSIRLIFNFVLLICFHKQR